MWVISLWVCEGIPKTSIFVFAFRICYKFLYKHLRKPLSNLCFWEWKWFLEITRGYLCVSWKIKFLIKSNYNVTISFLKFCSGVGLKVVSKVEFQKYVAMAPSISWSIDFISFRWKPHDNMSFISVHSLFSEPNGISGIYKYCLNKIMYNKYLFRWKNELIRVVTLKEKNLFL